MDSYRPEYSAQACDEFAEMWDKDLRSADTEFTVARKVVRLLGAEVQPGGLARFLFWTPELVEQGIRSEQVKLEVLIVPQMPNLRMDTQTLDFERFLLPTKRIGSFTMCVAEGIPAGSRDRFGGLYRLAYHQPDGSLRYIVDPMAASLPFGADATAEIYDVQAMLAGRRDEDYFHGQLDTEMDPDGIPRVRRPANMMEVHTATATEEGSLAALSRLYSRLAHKIEHGEELTPAETCFVGYDAIQLMPIEPCILYEGGPDLWSIREQDDHHLKVEVRKPDTITWGYDIITVGSPAPNPVLLESGRPDELVDLISVLHRFPGKPIRFVLDVVYGHADNQALPLLNRHYFAGSNMYGQNINYTHPMVRAIILDMQRRKSDFGADGVRVDGAQDFKYYVEDDDRLYHDDEFLSLMNDVEQHVAGVRYRPWMVFEDGRPWPRDDWELKSSYREVTKRLPNVVQWGPLSFAHNTPFLFTFWVMKWWRIEEMLEVGDKWITGTSNHDTLRRGTQVDPQSRINTYLGDSLPDIFRHAYDNPATRLFDIFMPGVPMDFLHANVRAPWSFVRNTDRRWAAKVLSEEAFFLDWVLSDALYGESWVFSRLKARGFESLQGLKRFVRVLGSCLAAADQDTEKAAHIMEHVTPRLEGPANLGSDMLVAIARDWMEDVNELCRVPRHTNYVDESIARYALDVRDFRRSNPWLVESLRAGEYFDRLRPTDGSVITYGMRTDPESGKCLLFVANMEGEPRTVIPAELPVPGLAEMSQGTWTLLLATPGLSAGDNLDAALILENSSGAIWRQS